VRIDTFNSPTGIPEPEHVHSFQQRRVFYGDTSKMAVLVKF